MIATHIHVSEREIAHVWPDGRQDDGAWEDCTFCTAVEFARLCHSPAIPATHAYAELLRAVSGRGVLGGTNQGDVLRAFAVKFNWTTGISRLGDWTALWAQLSPGRAASVMGRTGIFPAGHRLRRWDPGFTGGHCLLAIRLDDTDRVWWCDPLAPVTVTGAGGHKSTYNGEWVSKNDLKAYVDALPGGEYLVADLLPPEDDMRQFTPLPSPAGTATVNGSGHAVFSLTVPTTYVQVPAGAHYPVCGKGRLLVDINSGPGDRKTFYLVSIGGKAMCLLADPVSATFTPSVPPPPAVVGFTQADLDAALKADRLKARIIYG